MVYPSPPICTLRFFPGLLVLVAATLHAPAIADDAADPKPKPTAPDALPVAVPAELADLRAIERRVKAVVAKAVAATVAVRVGTAQGSGVVVTEDGYVLTAGHVAAKPGQDVLFTFADGKKARGTTLGIQRRADAGLAKISDEGPWPHVEMGHSEPIPLGTWCVAVGHPLGYQEGRPPVIRLGRLLQRRDDALQTDCPLVAGDSGGPLFDLDGKVIGVNSRIGGSTRVNLHVPVDVYHECWQRLAAGDDWDDGTPGKDSAVVKAAFHEVVARAGACVVRVQCDGKDAALGTIVGPDGWVVTKASELRGRIVCRTRDARQFDARIVGVHPGYDLAMLKVETTGLPSVAWSGKRGPAVGQWVAVPGAEEGPPLAVGVIGVRRRRIPAAGGVLGVGVGEADEGVKVVKILPNSPAAKAGLQVDDVITHVDGDPAQGLHEVIAAIRRHAPGHTVRLTLQRGDQTLEVSASLVKLDTPGARKREMQNRSHVGISKRHDDFPPVLQHDAVVCPADCGGPLVDLSGKVVGVNIARGGRTETYSVPADVLLGLMYDLISGRLRPTEEDPGGRPDDKQPGANEQPPRDEEGEPGPEDEPESGSEQRRLAAAAVVVYAVD